MFFFKNKISLVFLFILSISSNLFANYLPQNNSILNFTQVMFEFDEIENANNYILYINDNKSKEKKITSKSLAVLVNDYLEFGKTYSWYVKAFNNRKLLSTSNVFNFSISTHQNIDSTKVKFWILKADKNKFNNDLLFIDNLGIAINRKGIPVWFLPDRENAPDNKNNYRTLQMTKDGNLTFIYNSNCYETDLYGNQLWQSPNKGVISGDASEYYHHDFCKTIYNSYVCASYKYMEQPNYYDNKVTSRIRYNTLIEYDKYGNVLWSWNENDFVKKSFIFQNDGSNSTEVAGTHLNGFVFNNVDNSYFLSFRNTSQIYKIDYPSGKILYYWDGKIDFKQKLTGINFWSQHGPSVTKDGDLLVYNNNVQPRISEKEVLYPTVLILSNPSKDSSSVKLWEYECKWEKKPEGIQSKEGFAKELLNNNILVSVGGTERIFEVTRDKKVVWDCTFAKYSSDSSKFLPFSNYRCNNTSSLYPIYFTIQNSKNKNCIIINNNGSNADKYKIGIYRVKDSAEINNNIYVNINANKNIEINLTQYLNNYIEPFFVTVKSDTKLNYIKKINVTFKID